MNKNFLFCDKSYGDKFKEDLYEQCSYLDNINFCLTEIGFCSSSDNRVWTSNIDDIDGGDNFADYCKEFFNLLNEEDYYDN